MASTPKRPGRAPGFTGGVLPRAPAALRQTGPGRHRATDRYPPGPHPGAPLPQGPAGAALAQDRGDPRPAQEDGRGARPGASRLPRAEAGTEAKANTVEIGASHSLLLPWV